MCMLCFVFKKKVPPPPKPSFEPFMCLDFVLFIIFVIYPKNKNQELWTHAVCVGVTLTLVCTLDSCFITIMGCVGSVTRCCRRPSQPWRGSCLRRVNPLKTRWPTSSTPSPSPWASFTESLTCSPTNGLCFSWLSFLFLILHILFCVVFALFTDLTFCFRFCIVYVVSSFLVFWWSQWVWLSAAGPLWSLRAFLRKPGCSGTVALFGIISLSHLICIFVWSFFPLQCFSFLVSIFVWMQLHDVSFCVCLADTALPVVVVLWCFLPCLFCDTALPMVVTSWCFFLCLFCRHCSACGCPFVMFLSMSVLLKLLCLWLSLHDVSFHVCFVTLLCQRL